ncbi:hypothetical protein B0I35DRAFT_426669 [Stachybotrys elegans]|uniref:Uncharacterized protein n=1 Tax=Stachybotrys elegans TaxID=80388 RepID=A0A8K0SVS3_9HYPO|nr:hypothetical protein B0I35DRAFT_426669 [Stachybotrys elegans]
MSPSATIQQKPRRALDTITEPTEPLSSMSSISSLVALLVLAYKVKIPPHSHRERLSTLMKTMTPDGPGEYTHDELLLSFIRFLSPVLQGMAGMEDFQSAVEAFTQPDDYRDFWTIEGHNLVREVIEGDGCPVFAQGSDKDFLEVFVKDPSRRIAYGRGTGCLILVPSSSTTGDMLWGQDDFTDLEVIRESGDARKSIGHAFVDLDGVKAE